MLHLSHYGGGGIWKTRHFCTGKYGIFVSVNDILKSFLGVGVGGCYNVQKKCISETYFGMELKILT